MKNFSTWILVMFMVMFWILRIVIAVAAQLKWDIAGMVPLNQQMEIVLLFVVLVCIILVVKRKLIGGLLYLLSYGIYFGVDIANNMQNIFNVAGTTPDLDVYINLVLSMVGVILPIAVMLDLLADKNRKNHPKDKKTDWFYKNEKFDRQLDERADKNNYRTL